MSNAAKLRANLDALSSSTVGIVGPGTPFTCELDFHSDAPGALDFAVPVTDASGVQL